MTTKLTLIASAILLAAIPLGQLEASAATSHNMETRQVVFRYDGKAAPQTIYSQLKHTARHACAPFVIRNMKTQRQCTADLLDKAVTKIDRADITAVHMAPDSYYVRLVASL
jgi:hypothetical protein